MTDIKRGAHGGRNLEHQAIGGISQANPVSTTLYTALAQTGRPCRIISMMIQVTWTVQPTPLEIVLTIDGVAMTFAFANPVSATSYFAILKASAADNAQVLTTIDYGLTNPACFLIEGSNVLIQGRTTGGTTSNLTVVVRYAVK